jgi:hypothetical protein
VPKTPPPPQAGAEEGDKRVQYQLVLPDEKTPETVKPEEHNPFESENELHSRQNTGDTEENRVRDKLLKLPVVGVNRDVDGRMRVLLGDIILETGHLVPPVLPNQLVELRVKNITAQYIELAWQEKRMTGLPPKLMLIPINIDPQVRYVMHGRTEEDTKKSRSVNAMMSLPQRDVAKNTAQPATPAAPGTAPAAPRAQLVADDPTPFSPPRMAQPADPAAAQAVASAPAPAEQPQKPAASAPPSPAVESVVRMLFGNPTPGSTPGTTPGSTPGITPGTAPGTTPNPAPAPK